MKWFRQKKHNDIKSTLQHTWDYDLIALMRKDKAGDGRELQEFLKTYAPFAVINERRSRLLVLRPYRVEYWSDGRHVLNVCPDNGDFQWGISITNATDAGLTQSVVPVPNDRNYSGLKIWGGDCIEILLEGEDPVLTNYAELCFKLALKSDDREQAITDRFRLLCNKQVIITLEGGPPETVKRLVAIADQKLCSKFYEPVLSQMEEDMVLLKNEYWLHEEEESVSVSELRRRISMERIVFDTDGSILIYCNDDGLFGWHSIQIEVDADGNYSSAGLAG